MKTATEPKRAFNERDCAILENYTDIKKNDLDLFKRIKAGEIFDKSTYRRIQGMVKAGNKVYGKNRSYMLQSPSREEAGKVFLSQRAFAEFYQEFVLFKETVGRCTNLEQKDFEKTHQELTVEATENLCNSCKLDIRDCGKHKDSKALVKFPLLKQPIRNRLYLASDILMRKLGRKETENE